MLWSSLFGIRPLPEASRMALRSNPSVPSSLNCQNLPALPFAACSGPGLGLDPVLRVTHPSWARGLTTSCHLSPGCLCSRDQPAEVDRSLSHSEHRPNLSHHAAIWRDAGRGGELGVGVATRHTSPGSAPRAEVYGQGCPSCRAFWKLPSGLPLHLIDKHRVLWPHLAARPG